MKTLFKIVSVIAIISLGVNIWQWYNPRVVIGDGKVVYMPGAEIPAIVYDLPNGTQSVTVKNSPEYKQATQQAQEMKELVKYIPDLENTDKIASLTQAKMQLELKLSEKDMTLNDLQKQRKTWEDKYNSVTVDNSTNDVAVTSEVSPIIATVDKREAFYKPKESYTVISSPNTSVKFYGLESFTFKNPKPKDFVELNLKLEGLLLNKSVIPFGGAELVFNPDGKLKPVIGYGYYYDNASGKPIPYWAGGLQFNLLRF